MATCPGCGSEGPHALVVSMENPWAPGETLHYYRCTACRSLLVPKGTFHQFSDSEASPVSLQHYVQLGAGIDGMIQPAERARSQTASRLLDVGCGFGFTLDYWRHEVGGESVGVEPSAFGRLGAEMLGVELHVALLADVPSLRGRLFDVVLSSEVIEHVPDPAAFVYELRQHLAPGGTLVLTTPNAGFVTPENSFGTVLATLSPGLHKLLFSQEALDGLLRQAGFTHVQIEGAGPQLVAWAAMSPLALRNEPAALRDGYVDYLDRRWAEPAMGLDLQLGFGYRLLKELVNAARLDAAIPVAARLRDLIRQRYGFDIVDPAAVRSAVLPISALASYAVAAPFALGPILFYRAIAAAQGVLLEKDAPAAVDAAAVFALAHEVLAQSLRVQPDHFQEATALVWAALLEQAAALLRAGYAEAAAECLARLDAARAEPPPDCPVKVQTDVAQRALALHDAVTQALVPATAASPPKPPQLLQPPEAQPRWDLRSLWRRLKR